MTAVLQQPSYAFRPFTDEAHMQRLFQERLPGLSGTALTQCRILYTRYKPYFIRKKQKKSFLTVAYDLTLTQLATGAQRSQLIFAKIYQAGRSAQVYAEAARQALYPTDLGIPLAHLENLREGLGMVVWVFPNDPVLRHLPAATDLAAVKKHLPGWLKTDDSRIDIELVRYCPESRFTAWYRIKGAGEPTKSLLGKSYATNRYRVIYRKLAWLWHYVQNKPETFLMSRPAGYSDALKTYWQEALAAESLLKVIGPETYSDDLASAARQLVFLHRCPMPASRRETHHERLLEVKKKAKKLARAFPELEERLSKLSCQLEASLTRLNPPTCLIHGDFHLGQLLVHEGKLVLCDFDACGLGDPVEDLAHFMVDLHRYDFDKSLIEAMSCAFLRSYCQESGWLVPAEHLVWQFQVEFISRAYRSYIQKPHLASQVVLYLTLAEEVGKDGVCKDLSALKGSGS